MMRTHATLRALDDARYELEQATTAARRTGELMSRTGAGAAWDDAYEAWMRARAQCGDAFALSLGYTGTGWSYEVWEKDWRKRHPELKETE